MTLFTSDSDMLIGKLELRREISWLESSLRNSDVPFWCNCLFCSLTYMIVISNCFVDR